MTTQSNEKFVLTTFYDLTTFDNYDWGGWSSFNPDDSSAIVLQDGRFYLDHPDQGQILQIKKTFESFEPRSEYEVSFSFVRTPPGTGNVPVAVVTLEDQQLWWRFLPSTEGWVNYTTKFEVDDTPRSKLELWFDGVTKVDNICIRKL